MQLTSLHIFLAMAVAQQLPQVQAPQFGMHNGRAVSAPAILPVLKWQQHECHMHGEMPV